MRFKDENNNSPILLRETFGIDGELIEFQWKFFPGLPSLTVLREVQKNLLDRKFELEDFQHRIIFMSMFNDTDWTRKGNLKTCIRILSKSRIMRRDSRKVIGHPCGQDMNSIGTEFSIANLTDNGILWHLPWWTVVGWCAKFCRTQKEMKNSVKSDTIEQKFPEGMPRNNIEKSIGRPIARISSTFFGKLNAEIQFARVCGVAGFPRVSEGMQYKTVLDINDGFGGWTPAIREHTLS